MWRDAGFEASTRQTADFKSTVANAAASTRGELSWLSCQIHFLSFEDWFFFMGQFAGSFSRCRKQAALSGSAEAVRFLLDRDVSSLETEDQEGRTALHLASGHR